MSLTLHTMSLVLAQVAQPSHEWQLTVSFADELRVGPRHACVIAPVKANPRKDARRRGFFISQLEQLKALKTVTPSGEGPNTYRLGPTQADQVQWPEDAVRDDRGALIQALRTLDPHTAKNGDDRCDAATRSLCTAELRIPLERLPIQGKQAWGMQCVRNLGSEKSHGVVILRMRPRTTDAAVAPVLRSLSLQGLTLGMAIDSDQAFSERRARSYAASVGIVGGDFAPVIPRQSEHRNVWLPLTRNCAERWFQLPAPGRNESSSSDFHLTYEAPGHDEVSCSPELDDDRGFTLPVLQLSNNELHNVTVSYGPTVPTTSGFSWRGELTDRPHRLKLQRINFTWTWPCAQTTKNSLLKECPNARLDGLSVCDPPVPDASKCHYQCTLLEGMHLPATVTLNDVDNRWSWRHQLSASNELIQGQLHDESAKFAVRIEDGRRTPSKRPAQNEWGDGSPVHFERLVLESQLGHRSLVIDELDQDGFGHTVPADDRKRRLGKSRACKNDCMREPGCDLKCKRACMRDCNKKSAYEGPRERIVELDLLAGSCHRSIKMRFEGASKFREGRAELNWPEITVDPPRRLFRRATLAAHIGGGGSVFMGSELGPFHGTGELSLDIDAQFYHRGSQRTSILLGGRAWAMFARKPYQPLTAPGDSTDFEGAAGVFRFAILTRATVRYRPKTLPSGNDLNFSVVAGPGVGIPQFIEHRDNVLLRQDYFVFLAAELSVRIRRHLRLTGVPLRFIGPETVFEYPSEFWSKPTPKQHRAWAYQLAFTVGFEL